MNNSSGVKTFFEYLPESIRFHKLKNEGLARFIFVLVLFCQLVGRYALYKYTQLFPIEEIEKLYANFASFPSTSSADIYQPSIHILYAFLVALGISLLSKLVSNLFLLVYMYSYLSEQRGKDCGFRASFSGVFRHTGRIILYNIVFGLLVVFGSMFFVIPGIIAYVMFVFGFCYVLDLKLTMADAMTASSEVTKGKKVQIASILVAYFAIFKLPVLLLVGNSTSGVFIGAFLTTVTNLILQRFITKIYMDLEYKVEVTHK
ncbi:hypothetical protein [Ruminiclostridium cellulolyticum]|uniref:Uncharacterized protein n=1 Tax=Ruminiclostridium cellulolyticum (strain ATCC 35319 / DSM 5812 / JCM 6584 / H10) TaxID=394503 RepID=B8I400_RUMCH|nr:hypothetical protein [Ruminiclostridium cellulolyticum]ACL76433.1 hypothetical protein Ccel_2088 [Ruminiclostridium cellulolyticum H10]